jgi:hypothetical protein
MEACVYIQCVTCSYKIEWEACTYTSLIPTELSRTIAGAKKTVQTWNIFKYIKCYETVFSIHDQIV